MGKYDRLTDYIFDYFPDPTYTSRDIRDWAKENVPAWKVIPKEDKRNIIQDWKDFIAPKVPKIPRKYLRDKRGRFRRKTKAEKFVKPKVPKIHRPRDRRGRFVKWTKNVNNKIKKFLGRNY